MPLELHFANPDCATPLAVLIYSCLRALQLELGAGWKGAVSTALARLFGQVRQVIITDSLREQFCSLPFPLVLQWAGLDRLAVDSENSVAVLLTAWYRQQCSSGNPPTNAQCKQLSGCLRLGQLSPSYLLQVLQRLPWWRQPTNVPPHKLAVAGMAKLQGNFDYQLSDVFKEQAFQHAPRDEDGDKEGKLEWQASVAQLTASFDDRKRVNLSPTLYWAGWEWSCHIKWQSPCV